MPTAKDWISAFRLRTLPLAFSCIFMGAFLAYAAGVFNWPIFLLTLLTTLSLQVLSNLANDYGDAVSGVDSAQRSGPSRAVQRGAISAGQMKTAITVFVGLSLLFGCLLLWQAFQSEWKLALLFLLLGIAAIAAAIKYTVGKNPYGYAGLGDLFVFVFFGLVGVSGSLFLFTKSLETLTLLPAASCGFLAVGVLNLNNIRDIESDKSAGKRSIPVRIGRKLAIWYHAFLLMSALVSMGMYALSNGGGILHWLFLLVTPLLTLNLLAVNRKSGMALDPYLRQLALTTLIFVLLSGVGMILSA